MVTIQKCMSISILSQLVTLIFLDEHGDPIEFSLLPESLQREISEVASKVAYHLVSTSSQS